MKSIIRQQPDELLSKETADLIFESMCFLNGNINVMHVKDVALLFGCDDSILLDDKDGSQYVTKEQFFESVSIYNMKIWEENRKRMERRKKRHSEKYELNNTMKLLTKQNIKLIPEIEKGFNDILDAYEDLNENIAEEAFKIWRNKRNETKK